MTERIDLNGSDWYFKDFVGEDWIWRNAEKPDSRDVRWWRKGTVPGSVLHDVWKNGETADPLFERNSLLVEWVPERTWLYKKTFRVPETLRGKRVRLYFKGVDYEAQFFLNGHPIGRHAGMYTPAIFEVEDNLLYGEDNLLAVVIEKAPDEQPQVSKTSYVRTHKSRMTYWWDFCPRMIHQGIWDDVYLEVSGPVCIEDVYVRPQLAEDMRSAEVFVETALSVGKSSVAADERTAFDVKIELQYRGAVAATASIRHEAAPGPVRLDARLELADPELWWPNGSGPAAQSGEDARQYEAIVRVEMAGAGGSGNAGLTGEGAVAAGEAATTGEGSGFAAAEGSSNNAALSSERTVVFGVRDIRFIANESPETKVKPYTLVVNGEKTYIKGWNWVPMDVMYGVPRPEKLERLLTLARRAGVNLLRVWGGGLIEKDSFYELCSRYGIMVWQEFIQSSSGIANKPSEDSEFLEMMANEAETIIPLKRNHASLILWCGGNELQGPGDVPLDDDEPVLAILKEAVLRLHPGALWLPTSPSGRLFMNSLANAEADPHGMHDVHGPWEHQGLKGQYELYNRGTSLLHSEFGVEGMTNLKTLNATISEANRWPTGRDNPVYFHRGSWWNNEALVQSAFGGLLADPPALVRASQFLQAEGLRYALEANRRRKWRNSGSLPWQFNEPFPNAYCTSALDYYAQPKAVYYAVAKAYRPVSISASFAMQAWDGEAGFAADVWAASSSPRPLGALQAAWRLVGAGGTIYAEGRQEAALKPQTPEKLLRIDVPFDGFDDNVFFLALELTDASGAVVADNRYTYSRTATLEPLLSVPETSVRVEKSDAGGRWQLQLENTGAHAAVQLRLEDARPVGVEGYVYFSDNDFTLLPGERREISVDWSGVAEPEREIELAGWNAAVQSVR